MIHRCLPAATVAALLLAAPASADSLSITVNVIPGSASLPSVVFRSGGVVTLPTGNDVVAITIGGLTVGGLSGRGHLPREVSSEGSGPKWDTSTLRDAHWLNPGRGFAFGAVGSGVAEDFSGSSNDGDDEAEEGNSGHGGSNAAENAALDRTVVFAGGGSENNPAAVLLLSGGGNGSAVRAALGVPGLNGNGNLLAVSDDQPIANPEPTSMLLLGTGLAGLAALRRRRSAGQDPIDR